MQINTKFEIGEEVYVVDNTTQVNNTCKCCGHTKTTYKWGITFNKPLIISKITPVVYKEKTFIKYECRIGVISKEYNEVQLFRNKEDAIKSANEENELK
jgi:hypothetical protein